MKVNMEMKMKMVTMQCLFFDFSYVLLFASGRIAAHHAPQALAAPHAPAGPHAPRLRGASSASQHAGRPAFPAGRPALTHCNAHWPRAPSFTSSLAPWATLTSPALSAGRPALTHGRPDGRPEAAIACRSLRRPAAIACRHAETTRALTPALICASTRFTTSRRTAATNSSSCMGSVNTSVCVPIVDLRGSCQRAQGAGWVCVLVDLRGGGVLGGSGPRATLATRVAAPWTK